MGSLKITLTLFVLLAVAAAAIWFKAPSLLPERTEPGGNAPTPPGEPHGLPPSLAIKQAAVERLLAGELTLLEAGRHFRFATQHPEATLAQLPEVLSARPEDLLHCPEVVAWAGRELTEAGHPDRDAILAELSQELHDLFRKQGPRPLPPVGPEDPPVLPEPQRKGELQKKGET
jgi:hypothetical protein